MESGINKPLKVVWICYFSNDKIQKALRIRKNIPEFAPWISLGILEAEKRNDIELHIVSPHRWINRVKKFSDNNIHYYFFNFGIPFYGRHWPGFFKFDYWTNFFITKRKVRNIVSRIRPDIIHLHGAENADYSSAILSFFNKYPVLVTIQGFIRNTSGTHDYVIRKRINAEEKIIKQAQHFGARCHFMPQLISSLNQKAIFHWHNYPVNTPNVKLPEVKTYDIVFFAKVKKDKGIIDLIKASGIIVKEISSLKIKVIGAISSQQYLNYLQKIAKENNVLSNLEFIGFLPTQHDVHELAVKAKISVLPTHHDIIPGTVIESMLMKLPVISYNVGGLPDLNANGVENVILTEKGDISGLANSIIKLLNSNTLRNKIANSGYNRAIEMFDNNKVIPSLIKSYNEVINDFRK